MIRSGFCSVTFREMSIDEIVDAAVEAGLQSIEWGGDVHCRPGDLETAAKARLLTVNSGLEVAAYGSYYRAGSAGTEFGRVLDVAVALSAPTIRVWAGDRGSADADEAWWRTVIEDLRAIAHQAAEDSIGIALEYHPGTLTDSAASAVRLLTSANHPNVSVYWQTDIPKPVDEREDSLRALLPWVSNLHVFAFQSGERRELVAAREEWLRYLTMAAARGGDRYALLEFTRGGKREQFLEDAALLRQLLETVDPE